MMLQTKDALNFILAGKAIFTIRSLKTGKRYTYRVKKAVVASNKPDMWFVQLLTGPDNTSSFTYIGIIRDKKFILTPKSQLPKTALPVAAISWLIAKLTAMQEIPDAEIWHEGRCGRCGRKLTVPESIASGFGPECSEILGHGQVMLPLGQSVPAAPVTCESCGEEKPCRCEYKAAYAAQERDQEELAFMAGMRSEAAL